MIKRHNSQVIKGQDRRSALQYGRNDWI